MTDDGWTDAGLSAWFAWERLSDARGPLSQAQAMLDLSQAMSDLVTWLPGYDVEISGIREDG